MSKLAKNVLYNLAGQGVVLLLGFLAVRQLSRALGGDVVGIVYFAMALAAVLSAVLDLGISSTIVREVAANHPGGREYVRRLMQTSSLFYWGAYLCVCSLVVWIAPVLVTRWLSLSTIGNSAATEAVRLVGAGALLALPRSLYASLFRGLQRMEINNLIDAGAAALQQGGLFALLLLGRGLEDVSLWIVASNAAAVAAFAGATLRFVPATALLPSYHGDVVAKNLGYAVRMISVSVSSMVHTYADKAVASRFVPLASFGAYGFAYAAVSRATFLTGAIAQASFPALAELHSRGAREEMMAKYRKLQDVLCFGIVPLFAAVPFFTEALFGFIFGPETGRLLVLPLAFLALGYFMNGTLTIPHAFSLAVGRPGIAAASNLLALFVVLPVTAALVYAWGLNGAGLSWVVYHLFAYAYAVPRICRECLRIRPVSWYSHVIRCLLLAAGCYAPAWLAAYGPGGGALWAQSAGFSAATAAFLGIAARWMVGPDLRQSLPAFLRPRPA